MPMYLFHSSHFHMKQQLITGVTNHIKEGSVFIDVNLQLWFRSSWGSCSSFLPFKFRMSLYTDKVCWKQGRPLLEEFVPLPFGRRYGLPGEKLQYRFKFSLVPSVINELNVLLILDCSAQQHFILATSLIFKEQFHFLFLLVKCCCDVAVYCVCVSTSSVDQKSLKGRKNLNCIYFQRTISNQ